MQPRKWGLHRISEKNILTGLWLMNTLFADVIQNEFKNAEIKIAGLNIWDKSKNIIHTDFALYENTVIKAPMSKDSSEYKEFVRIYNRETKEGTL